MTKRRRSTTEVELQNLFDPRLVGAACVGHHQLFDHEADGETATDRLTRHAQAIAICRSCPVSTACIEVALEHLEHITGIWAGLSTTELERRTAS